MEPRAAMFGRVGLVMMAGALTPLCFEPFGWWPVMLVSLGVLLAVVARGTGRGAFYLGVVYGSVGYGLSLFWLTRLFGPTGMVLFVLLGLFPGVFCLAYNRVAAGSGSRLVAVVLAGVLWTGIEFYRAEVFPFCFPWITPGMALGPTWLTPVVGVYGGSFLLVAAAAALGYRRTAPVGLVLGLVVLGLGCFRPGRVEPPVEGGLDVMLVQNEDGFLSTYAELTREAAGEGVDLVIWPEYALAYDVRKNERRFGQLMELCGEVDAVLVVGTQTALGRGCHPFHNTALVIDDVGVLGEYHKIRPVHFTGDGVPGRDYRPLETEVGAMGTPICFDCDFTAVLRRMTVEGAEYFAVPSCDPELWGAVQHLQHGAMFRLRAAENGRWLAVAATSGVTQVIDPHGRVHGSLKLMEAGVLRGRIGRERVQTLYTRVGWLFPWVTLVGTAGAFAWWSVRWVQGLLVCRAGRRRERVCLAG